MTQKKIYQESGKKRFSEKNNTILSVLIISSMTISKLALLKLKVDVRLRVK